MASQRLRQTITAPQLAKMFGYHESTVHAILREARVNPVGPFRHPYHFRTSEACRVMRNHINKLGSHK